MNLNQDKKPIVEVGEANFNREVIQSKTPVLAAFRASWSRPCHVLDSVLDEVAVECEANLKVVKIDSDDNPDLSLLYEIKRIPTLLYFVDGNVLAEIVGTASKEAILAKLRIAFRAEHKPINTNTSTDL